MYVRAYVASRPVANTHYRSTVSLADQYVFDTLDMKRIAAILLTTPTHRVVAITMAFCKHMPEKLHGYIIEAAKDLYNGPGEVVNQILWE